MFARSLAERSTLKGELNQLRNMAQAVVAKVLGLGPGTNTPTIHLAEILDMVQTLISDGVFHGALGVLTSVVTHYPALEFEAICGEYATGWSMEGIQMLGQSLAPRAHVVAAHVTTQWVIKARHVWEATRANQEGVADPGEEVETRTESSTVPTATDPSVDPIVTEDPSSVSAAPPTDPTGGRL